MGITYTLHGNWKEVGRRRIAHENVVEVCSPSFTHGRPVQQQYIAHALEAMAACSR